MKTNWKKVKTFHDSRNGMKPAWLDTTDRAISYFAKCWLTITLGWMLTFLIWG